MECTKGFDQQIDGVWLPGAEALGEAVSSNHALQRLDLSNNGIKGAGAQTRRSMEHFSSSCQNCKCCILVKKVLQQLVASINYITKVLDTLIVVHFLIATT